MILEHYSANPVVAVTSRKQDPDTYRHSKPDGFWISVKGERDWPSWCRDEGFREGNLALRHVVTLMPSANILHVASAIQLDDFNDEYFKPGITPWASGIDWARVAERYDGIIIAPYQWNRRMSDHCGWYYGWDCASGCIWNSEAILSVDRIDEDFPAKNIA